MSINSINKEQVYQIPNYGNLGPFTNNPEGYYLPPDLFRFVLSQLDPKIHARFETVCKNWRLFISDYWAKLCQNKLQISSEIDPKQYLPLPSYNGSFQRISSKMLAEEVYRKYIGDVEPAAQIPETISLKRWNEKDPCDPSKKIGDAYVWMYCPSHIEVHIPGFDLDKPDDLNDPVAPRLIQKVGENKVLKVPVTIYNLIKLFKHVKEGNPSTCSNSNGLPNIIQQHGNIRIESQWRCERKDVIGRNLTWAKELKLARKKGVDVTQLIFRLMLNFLEHARSTPYTYLDGQNPWTFARTRTLTPDAQNTELSSGCGCGDWYFGLNVDYDSCDSDVVGLAVALSVEAAAAHPSA